MISSPVVTVVIPTYNRPKMLAEAVESVLAQTYIHWELIVVDDGSTDTTGRSLRPLMNRLRYFKQPNRGPSSARNVGIKEAQGEFVAFLDSDDLWKPGKLEVQVEYMRKHPDVKVCQTEELWIRRGVRVNPMKKHKKYSGWIFDKMLPLCIVSPSAVMLRRDLFDEVGFFDESLPVCEDYDLWLRIGYRYPIMLIPEPLVLKRGGHSDQQSRRFWGMDRFRIQALRKLLEREKLNFEQRKLVIDELGKKCRVVAQGCQKRGRMQEAEQCLRLVSQYLGGEAGCSKIDTTGKP